MFDFEIGQQVVCVEDIVWWDFHKFQDAPKPWPVKDSVYTIHDIERCKHFYLGLRLDGLHGCWTSSAFRPCRKTSIEQFRHHLVTPPKKLEPV